jgi:hypothetical protein
MTFLRRVALVAGLGALAVAAPAGAMTVHVQGKPAARKNVLLSFSAAALPEGGYYYAVIVLKPYRQYRRNSPPPCSVSSDMQRADYGRPGPKGVVALALTPARSKTRHWCPGGSYQGAIYAVPHAPPCEGTYPCASEPYKPPSPCWSIEGHVVCGVVVRRSLWAYPDPLPAPVASGTKILGRFAVRFPAR